MREAMLFVHFLGLILGMGSGFASLFIGLYNKTIPKDEAPKFVLRLRSLGYMGLAGIILLILSGGYLATPYWSMIGSMPYFITKLALVFVLTVIVILIDQKWRRAIKNNGGADLAAIQKLGRLAFPVGILILLFAVLQFR
jgi:fatty acid desaturase